MANKKIQIAAGLAGLMAQPAQLEGLKSSAPQEPTGGSATASAQKVKGNYKTVCYSIPPELADRMRAQALREGRTIGSTVARAFREYLEQNENI